VAEVNRVDPHHLEVTVRGKGEEQPYFHRVFADSETREVSLKMWGGDDRVVVRGNDPSAIRVRVVSGAGDDVLVDSTASGGTRFYDDQGTNVTEGSRPIDLNTRRYDEWIGSDTNRYPPREWGTGRGRSRGWRSAAIWGSSSGPASGGPPMGSARNRTHPRFG
jgi:hypothetical protein